MIPGPNSHQHQPSPNLGKNVLVLEGSPTAGAKAQELLASEKVEDWIKLSTELAGELKPESLFQVIAIKLKELSDREDTTTTELAKATLAHLDHAKHGASVLLTIPLSRREEAYEWAEECTRSYRKLAAAHARLGLFFNVRAHLLHITHAIVKEATDA